MKTFKKEICTGDCSAIQLSFKPKPIVFLLYIITKCCCGYDIYYVHTLLSVKYMKCKIIYNQNSNIILISIGIYCSEYIKQLTIIIIEAFKLKYLNRDYWNVIFMVLYITRWTIQALESLWFLFFWPLSVHL
jgi:hypothetical protein